MALIRRLEPAEPCARGPCTSATERCNAAHLCEKLYTPEQPTCTVCAVGLATSEVWWMYQFCGHRFSGANSGKCITRCLKKVTTFELSVTLSNLNRYSKFLHCCKAYEVCYKNPCYITHLTLGKLLHYLGKLIIQIFCWYSAGMAEMQTSCILIASNFVIRPRILIFSVFKIVSVFPYWSQIKFYQKIVLVAEYHVECWQTLQWRLLWWISSATNWSQK